MYNLEQQLAVMNQDMSVILTNISEIKSELGSVDNAIQLYYTWFTTINTNVTEMKSNLSMVWDAIFALEADLANAASCQLVAYGNCVNVDLSGVNLSDMNLTGINFRGVNLHGAIFDRATLDNANFENTNIANASFIKSGLNYSTFYDVSAYTCYYVGWGQYCSGANLYDAAMYHTSIEKSRFQYTNLSDTGMAWSKIVQSNLNLSHSCFVSKCK